MTISASIQALISGELVASSRLNRKLVDELIAEGLITVVAHGSKKSYRARDIEALKGFLIDMDESYRILEVNNFDSRASMAAETGNSKLSMVRSCPGFMVNSYTPIPARIGDNKITISPEDGTMLFIADWEQFFIPNNVLVVGIENMENFRHVRKQKHLFPDKSILFVSRYPQSKDLINWLKQISNQYLHFGDFDLAGMHIYETEFYKHIQKRATFFIPNDIENRLQNGSAERYNNQYKKFKNFFPTDNRLLSLFNLIHKYSRCYDQEGYII